MKNEKIKLCVNLPYQVRIHEFSSDRAQRIIGAILNQRQLTARKDHAHILIIKVELLLRANRRPPRNLTQIARIQVANHQRVRSVRHHVPVTNEM